MKLPHFVQFILHHRSYFSNFNLLNFTPGATNFDQLWARIQLPKKCDEETVFGYKTVLDNTYATEVLSESVLGTSQRPTSPHHR